MASRIQEDNGPAVSNATVSINQPGPTFTGYLEFRSKSGMTLEKETAANVRVLLKGDGTYKVPRYFSDEGTYEYSKADSNQPENMIFFFSRNHHQYFAYPKGKMFEAWLDQPRVGVNLWVDAVLADNQPISVTDETIPIRPLSQPPIFNDAAATQEIPTPARRIQSK